MTTSKTNVLGGSGVVVVLEDNSDDFYFLHRAWKARGNSEHLVQASDGLAAQDFLKSGNSEVEIKLIITDLKMPRCDGFSFIEWLRSDSKLKDTRCVVLSSSAHQSDVERAKRLGADAFFTKPSDSKAFAIVLDHIQRHLEQNKEFFAFTRLEWLDSAT